MCNSSASPAAMTDDTNSTNAWDETVPIRVPKAQRDESNDLRPDHASHGDCLVAGAKALAGEWDGDVDALADAIAERLADADDVRAAAERGAADALEDIR